VNHFIGYLATTEPI